MKFQIGDRVLILHSNEEGEVIDIINNKMVMVDVRGVKFPAYVDQLDFPYFKKFSESKLFPKQKGKKYIDDIKKEKGAPKVADGMWITFLPVMETDEFGDEVVNELKIHLINRTDTAYNFIYTLHYFGKADFDLKNEVLPFQDFYLHDIPFERFYQRDHPVKIQNAFVMVRQNSKYKTPESVLDFFKLDHVLDVSRSELVYEYASVQIYAIPAK